MTRKGTGMVQGSAAVSPPRSCLPVTGSVLQSSLSSWSGTSLSLRERNWVALERRRRRISGLTSCLMCLAGHLQVSGGR